MRKYIKAMICFCVLSLVIISFIKSGTVAVSSSPYLPKDNPLGEGVKNIFLFDVKTTRNVNNECIRDTSNGNCITDDDGDKIIDYTYSYSYDKGYINLLNYVDENGNITNNKFMDTFVVLACDARLEDRMSALAEVNNKISEINAENNLNIKINIIMGVCPGTNNADAKYGNGYGEPYNLVDSNGVKDTYTGTRYLYEELGYPSSVYNMIIDDTNLFYDTTGNSFSSKFANLKLIGFYWMHEDVGWGASSADLIKSFNNMVHGIGTSYAWLEKYNYKTLWVPYFVSHNRYLYGEISDYRFLDENGNKTNDEELRYIDNEHYVDSFGMCNKYGKDSNDEYINPACELGITQSLNTNRYRYKIQNGFRYYGDELYMYGYNYGFDFVSFQTNYAFHGNSESWNNYRLDSSTASTGYTLLDFADIVAKRVGAGIEVAIDPESSHNGSYYGYTGCSFWKERLTYGLPKEWNNTVNVYYMTNLFDPMYLNQGELARDYYESIYKFSNNTLTQNDIDKISCNREYYSGNEGYSNYINVSNGKSYSTNAKKYAVGPDENKEYGYYYYDTNGNGDKIWTVDRNKYCTYGSNLSSNQWLSRLYCDDGVKLTDGVMGKSGWSYFDEWTVFSVKPDNNTTLPYYITIDLGSKMQSLTYFGIELNNHKTGGIVTIGDNETITSNPTTLVDSIIKGSIKVYVSDTENGTYTEVGKLNLMENRNIFEAAFYELILNPNEAVSGRYIKFVIDYSGSDWEEGTIFVSETIVGKTSTIKPSSNKTILTSGIDSNEHSTTVDLALDNIIMANLKVSSENSNVATVSKTMDGIMITAVNVGKTKINIKDDIYGATITHDVEVIDEDLFEFSNDINYEVTNGILYQIEPGMTSLELFNTINTNADVSLIDKNGNTLTDTMKLKTGYKIRATFTTRVLEYMISVKGDVLGTGELSISNAKRIAKHVIDKKTISGEEYLLSADYNNDGKIKMNDVVKMLRDKRERENP